MSVFVKRDVRQHVHIRDLFRSVDIRADRQHLTVQIVVSSAAGRHNGLRREVGERSCKLSLNAVIFEHDHDVGVAVVSEHIAAVRFCREFRFLLDQLNLDGDRRGVAVVHIGQDRLCFVVVVARVHTEGSAAGVPLDSVDRIVDDVVFLSDDNGLTVLVDDVAVLVRLVDVDLRAVLESDGDRVVQQVAVVGVAVALIVSHDPVAQRVECDRIDVHVVPCQELDIHADRIHSVAGQLTGDRHRPVRFLIGEQCGRDLRQIPAEHVDRAECAVAVNDLNRARHRIGALQQDCDRVDLVGRLFVAGGACEVVANDLVAFDLDEHICGLQEPLLKRFGSRSRHFHAVGDKADLQLHRIVEGVVVEHRGELFHFFRTIILGEPDRQLARLAVRELDERRAREHRIVSAFPIVFRVREEHVRVDVQLARVARRRVGIAEPHLGDHVLDDVDLDSRLLPIVVFAVLFLVESDRRGRLLCRVVTDVIEREAGLGDLRGDVDRLAVAVAVLFVVRDRRARQDARTHVFVAGQVARTLVFGAVKHSQIDVVRVDLDRIEVVVLQQLRHLRPDVDVDRDRLRERAFADRAGDRTRDRAHVGGIIRPLLKRGCKSFGSGPSALSAVDFDRGSRTVFIVEEQHLGRKRRDRCVFFRQRVQVDHHRHAFGTDQFHHRTVEVIDRDRSRYAAGESDRSVDFASLERIDFRLGGSDVPVCDRRRTDRPCRAVGKMHGHIVRHRRVCVQRQVVDRHDTAVLARVFDFVGKRQDLQIDLDLALQSSFEVRHDGDRQLVAVVCTRGARSRHLEQQVRILLEHCIHIAAILLTSKLEPVECECHIGADNARAVLISRRLAREVFGHEGREVACIILIRFKDDRLGDLAPVDYTRLRTRNDVAQRAYRRELVIDPDLHRVVGVPGPAVVQFAVGTVDILHASVIAGDIDVRERAVHEVETRIELVEHRHRQDRRHDRPEDVFKDVVDRRADHTEQRRQVDADRVDDRRRGHDVGDDVVLDACREIVPESVVSAPFDVAQMVLREHLGSKLAEVEDRIASEDLVHQVVDQFVDRVGVERDVRVERTGRIELDVDASGEQIHDVEIVEQALQLGLKSALFRRSGFFLRRSRRFALRAAARAAVRAAARAAARLFGRRAVDAVLEFADESVEERSDHCDHAFARIRFDGAVAVVVSDLDVEVLIVEDAADVDEAAQHSDPARLGIDRDRAGVVVEHRIDETVHAALRVFVLRLVDLPDRDQECARGRSLTAGVGKHLLRAHLFDAHSEISEAAVRFECTVADVKRQIEVEVVEQALGDARAVRTVDDRRVGADIDRVVVAGGDLLLREHQFVDSVLTDRERELCAEGDVVVDGKVKQQLAVDHVEFDAQADVDAEAEARKASDDLVDDVGREFDKQRGVVRRNTAQQRL